MCGIFGYSSTKFDLSNLFFESLKHRGPDSKRAISIDNWTLGHLRLSIIDTSSIAHQPMVRKDNWIVFNGEIYNYLELKNKYLKHTSFSSSSDTEVLLALLNKKGLSILNELNGMFAFAWYSHADKKLFLCRDRFGVKPLYWMIEDDIFYFASEVRPLVKIKKSVSLSQDTIEAYIRETATDFLKESFISNVFQVLPGTYLEITDSCKVIESKWYLGSDYKFDTSIYGNKTKTLEYFEELLTDAIRIRYRADVPVCLTLSGGLDSTVLYVLTKERLEQDIATITFQNQGSSIDESALAKRLTAEYGDAITVLKNKEQFSQREIFNTNQILEFPIWNPSALAYLSIYKEIRKRGFRVVIEGHGSDEQLGGYPYLIEEMWKEKIKQGKIASAFVLFTAHQKALNKNLNQKSREWLFALFAGRTYLDTRKHDAKSRLHMSFDKTIIPIVLRAFDRLSMSQSLESRCPFMDYRLVEFIRDMPIEYRADELGSKAPLRHILKKYKKEYIYKNRPKLGFALDVPKFMEKSAIRKFLLKQIEDFDFVEFAEEKKRSQKLLSKEKISWPDTAIIWKIASLSMIKKMYE